MGSGDREGLLFNIKRPEHMAKTLSLVNCNYEHDAMSGPRYEAQLQRRTNDKILNDPHKNMKFKEHVKSARF